MHFRGDLGFKQDLLIGGGSIKNRLLMHFLWGFRVKAYIAGQWILRRSTAGCPLHTTWHEMMWHELQL